MATIQKSRQADDLALLWLILFLVLIAAFPMTLTSRSAAVGMGAASSHHLEEATAGMTDYDFSDCAQPG